MLWEMQWSLFFLCSVNGQYVKQGKLGAAVLGNHSTKEVRMIMFFFFWLSRKCFFYTFACLHPFQYKILLYVSQQKQVTAARIHSGFVLTVSTYSHKSDNTFVFYMFFSNCLSHIKVQPSSYCTFYDDQRQNWSLMFESENAATDFCKEVCILWVLRVVLHEELLTQ